MELAFKYAVYKINKDRNLLQHTTLVYDIQYCPKDDSFRTSKKVCKQIQSDNGVQVIFGPNDNVLGPHIQVSSIYPPPPSSPSPPLLPPYFVVFLLISALFYPNLFLFLLEIYLYYILNLFLTPNNHFWVYLLSIYKCIHLYT